MKQSASSVEFSWSIVGRHQLELERVLRFLKIEATMQIAFSRLATSIVIRLATGLCLLLMATSAMAQANQRSRPNILLIVSDDQRADTIAALGNDVIRTPNLDALMASGSGFSRAVCANPICTPSRGEILTGCNGFNNGVLDFGGRLRQGLSPIAETLSDAGYRTCYVGKWHKAGQIHEYVFGYFRNVQRMIRGDRWKLIHYPQIDKWQLFDLQNDPLELNNLADDPTYAGTKRDLQNRLHSWQTHVGDPLLSL